MNKTTIKTVMAVTGGVILAGFVLNQLRGNSFADQARAGFK